MVGNGDFLKRLTSSASEWIHGGTIKDSWAVSRGREAEVRGELTKESLAGLTQAETNTFVQNAMQDGAYKRVVAAYQAKNIEALSEDDFENYYKALIKSGEIQTAKKVLEKGAKRFPENKGILSELGDIYLKEMKLNKARDIFRKLHLDDPSDDEVLRKYADVLYESGWLRSLYAFVESGRIAPAVYSDLEDRLEEAQVNKYEEAATLRAEYEAADDVDKDDTSYAKRIVAVKNLIGATTELEKQKAFYKELFELDPNNEDLYIEYAKFLADKGEVKEAIKFLEETIVTYNNGKHHVNFSDERKRLLSALEFQIASNPKEYKKIYEDLSTLIDFESPAPELLEMYSISVYEMGWFRIAAYYLSQTYPVRPELVQAEAAGQKPINNKAELKAIKKHPKAEEIKQARITQVLTLINASTDNKVRAEFLEELLALDPESAEAKVLKAELLFEEKEYVKALSLLNEVPEEERVKILQAKIYLAQKRFDKARAKYLELNIENSTDDLLKINYVRSLVGLKWYRKAGFAISNVDSNTAGHPEIVNDIANHIAKPYPGAKEENQNLTEENREERMDRVLNILSTSTPSPSEIFKYYQEYFELSDLGGNTNNHPTLEAFQSYVGILLKESKKEAQKRLEAGLDKFPDDAELKTRKGDLFLEQSKYQEAKDIFEELIANDPDNDHLKTGLGRSLIHLGWLRKAEEITEGINTPNDALKADLKEMQSGLENPILVNPEGLTNFIVAHRAKKLKLEEELRSLSNQYKAKRRTKLEALIQAAPSVEIKAALYAEILELFPNDKDAYLSLGKLYTSGGADQDYKKAMTIFSNLSLSLREDPDINYELAWAYYHNKKYKEAASLFQKSVSSGKEDEAKRGHALCLFHEKQYSDFLAKYRELAEANLLNDELKAAFRTTREHLDPKSPDTIQARVGNGLKSLGIGQLSPQETQARIQELNDLIAIAEDPLLYYPELIKHDPYNVSVIQDYVNLLVGANRSQEAIKILEEKVVGIPLSFELIFNLANLLAEDGDFIEAKGYYENALAITEEPEAVLRYAICLNELGWYRSALEYLRKIENETFTPPELDLKLVSAIDLSKEKLKVPQINKEEVAELSDKVKTERLSYIKTRLQSLSKTEDILRKDFVREAVSLAPGDPDIIIMAARILYEEKKYDKVIAQLSKLRAPFNSRPEVQQTLAWSYHMQKEYEKALQHFRYLNHQPNTREENKTGLAYTLIRLGEYQEAIQILEGLNSTDITVQNELRLAREQLALANRPAQPVVATTNAQPGAQPVVGPAASQTTSATDPTNNPQA